jgi:predicted acyl esterase
MMNLKDNAATPSRTTVRIPTASGDELEARLYLPEGDGRHPAVMSAVLPRLEIKPQKQRQTARPITRLRPTLWPLCDRTTAIFRAP